LVDHMLDQVRRIGLGAALVRARVDIHRPN
jgi:hypothetical protein